MSNKYYKYKPRIIINRFNAFCAETGLPISKGKACLYMPKTKKIYDLDSDTAHEVRTSDHLENFGI